MSGIGEGEEHGAGVDSKNNNNNNVGNRWRKMGGWLFNSMLMEVSKVMKKKLRKKVVFLSLEMGSLNSEMLDC